MDVNVVDAGLDSFHLWFSLVISLLSYFLSSYNPIIHSVHGRGSERPELDTPLDRNCYCCQGYYSILWSRGGGRETKVKGWVRPPLLKKSCVPNPI